MNTITNSSASSSNNNTSTNNNNNNGSNNNSSQPEHCLETLLRNIEGLLAIAAHNARQQQSQLQVQKGQFFL